MVGEGGERGRYRASGGGGVAGGGGYGYGHTAWHQHEPAPVVPATVASHHPTGGRRRVDVSASTGMGAGRVVSSYD